MPVRPTSPAAVIAVLMAATLVAVSQLYLTVPLLPQVVARHGVSPTTAAWAGTAFGLAYAVGSLIFGTVSDRHDPRRVMAAGLAASAVATAAAGLAPTFGLLVAARTAEGFTAAAVPPVALAFVGDVLPPRRRAVGLAAISACFLLAGIAGQGYALGVGAALGWTWVYTLLVGPLLGCAWLITRLPAPARAAAGAGLGAAVARLARLLRRPPLLMGYLCALTLLLTFVAVYAALNAAVGDRYHITGAGPLLLVRLPGLPGIAAGAGAGWLINRVGPYRTGGLAFVTAATGMAVMAAAGPLWLLLAGSGVYVAGLAVAIPSAVAAVGAASGAHRGTGIAGYTFLIGVGGAVAPLLAAAVAGSGFAVLATLLAGALLVAAAALGLGPRPGPQPAVARPAEVSRAAARS